MPSFATPQRRPPKPFDLLPAPVADAKSSEPLTPLPDAESPATVRLTHAPQGRAIAARPLAPLPLFRPDPHVPTGPSLSPKQAPAPAVQPVMLSAPTEAASAEKRDEGVAPPEETPEAIGRVVQARMSVKHAGAGAAGTPPNAGGPPPVQRKNVTGLPDALKAGVEALSGVALDDVRVRYNSPRVAGMHALAYTQGREIHVGAGQERHLPHEAWHAVQQKQGRVKPTIRLNGVAVNDDQALEREADAMGATALRAPTQARDTLMQSKVAGAAIPAGGAVVQGLFDWAIDAANNRRKIGVEITEDRGDPNPATGLNENGLGDVVPTATWTGLGLPWKQAQWAGTVNLPNYAGATTAWRVATYANMVQAMFPYFTVGNGKKEKWMKWGEVTLTEDYGDFEWIIKHPNAPQGVTYYRDRLAEVSQSRVALRNALNGLGLGTNIFVLAMNDNPGPRQALWVSLHATDDASSQITIESTDRAITKRGLMEGLTHGLGKINVPTRSTLVDADPAIANTVTTAAARVPIAHVDMELVVAYLIADLTHKIATITTAADWGGAVAANFKQWRVLFPKSHPYQILLQAMDDTAAVLPAAAIPGAVSVALTAQRAAIIGDVTALFLGKLVGPHRSAQALWHPAFFSGADPITHVPYNHDPGNIMLNAAAGLAPLPPTNLTVAFNNFLNANYANYLVTEYDNAVNALTDPTLTQIGVVRSTGFAVHAPNTTGFAFEDRAEVDTTFPDLATTYERIKAIANRY